MKEFKLDNKKRIIEGISTGEIQNLNNISHIESEIDNIKISNTKITFQTEHPNRLHIVKVSYFPNWKIKNGSGPYRISPSFMAVIPHTNDVEIVFKNTPIENAVSLFSVIAFLFSIYFYIFRIRKYD